MNHNFRTAFSGFHKEDVVHYLEYINTKHQNQVNLLNAEIDELRRLSQAPQADPELEDRCRMLEEENQELRALIEAMEQASAEAAALKQENQALRARIEDMEQCCAEAPVLEAAPQEPPRASGEVLELEAYRKADRIQKDAQDRAELVYFQATTVLKEATARVENASKDITALTDQVMSQITQLQVAVSASKQALQEAAGTMGAIRPNR